MRLGMGPTFYFLIYQRTIAELDFQAFTRRGVVLDPLIVRFFKPWFVTTFSILLLLR